MIALVLALQLTTLDLQTAINDQLEVRLAASDAAFASTHELTRQYRDCTAARDAIGAAGAMRRALANGYLFVLDETLAAKLGGNEYNLGPDDRKVVEAQAVDYETEAQTKKLACERD